MAKTYDPKLVTLTFGTLIISGYSEGTFIGLAYNDEEEYKGKSGGDGEFSWTRNADRSARITIQLKTTSSVRVFLDQFAKLGTILPCFLRNRSDQQYVGGGVEARLVNRPAINLDMEEQDVEYIIEVADCSSATIPA